MEIRLVVFHETYYRYFFGLPLLSYNPQSSSLHLAVSLNFRYASAIAYQTLPAANLKQQRVEDPEKRRECLRMTGFEETLKWLLIGNTAS
jgi:hypothetical protein